MNPQRFCGFAFSFLRDSLRTVDGLTGTEALFWSQSRLLWEFPSAWRSFASAQTTDLRINIYHCLMGNTSPDHNGASIRSSAGQQPPD